jgi:hypothetical protein
MHPAQVVSATERSSEKSRYPSNKAVNISGVKMFVIIHPLFFGHR